MRAEFKPIFGILKGGKRTALEVLVNDLGYMRTDCFQHQLKATLEENFRVRWVTLADIQGGVQSKPGSPHTVLSCLKLRTLDQHYALVGRFLGGKKLIAYEQDAWQGFIDSDDVHGGKGSYQRIAKNLPLRSFLNTSNWWTEKVKSVGIPSRFVKMGILPKYCSEGRPWPKRRLGSFFQGGLRPARKELFDALAVRGKPVQHLSMQSFPEFLKNLSNAHIYIHAENHLDGHRWTMDGVNIPANALWVLDLQAAARGCYSLRDLDADVEAYGLGTIPTARTYRNLDEAVSIIDEIESMNLVRRKKEIHESVVAIRSKNNWMTVVEAIHELI